MYIRKILAKLEGTFPIVFCGGKDLHILKFIHGNNYNNNNNNNNKNKNDQKNKHNNNNKNSI